VPDPPVLNAARSGRLLAWALLGIAAVPVHAGAFGEQFTLGGNLSLTSDYIYHGVSESSDDPALQGDVHLDTSGGTFAGLWASTRDSSLDPGGSFEFELYLGHRFDLSSAWNVTLSARSHYFAGGVFEASADYQEVLATLAYEDRWALTLTAIPNAVRYWFYQRLTRSPAYVADTSGQWLIVPGVFLTAGAGYYYSSGTGPGILRSVGYAYGNAGLAWEWRNWRVDVGYFLTQPDAEKLFPYPSADRRAAATLTWRF